MKKIVVIEDNFEVRDNLVEILELSGYEVYQAEDGIKGVAMVQEHLPDLILCDVMMPRLDGYGVLKILSSGDSTKYIPFIFLTAKSEKIDFRKGMNLGADDYLTKPFDDTDLLETIQRRLNKAAERGSQTTNQSRSFFSKDRATAEILQLCQESELRSYDKSEVIYRSGTRCHWVYLVKSGRIKSYRSNEFGKELILNIHDEGDLFGHVDALTQKSHRESAETLDHAEVFHIAIDRIENLMLNQADSANALLRILAERISHGEEQLLELAYSSVRRKTANAILKITEGSQSEVEISRDDLAKIAGIAKETLIRTMSEFKSQGLISVDRDRIQVLQKEALESIPQ